MAEGLPLYPRHGLVVTLGPLRLKFKHAKRGKLKMLVHLDGHELSYDELLAGEICLTAKPLRRQDTD